MRTAFHAFTKPESGGETYPPLNSKTPVFVCGFECGQLGGVGQHWDLTGTVSIGTGTVRSGSRAARFNPSGASAALSRSVTPTVSVHRFYIRFASLPTGDIYIFHAANSTARLGVAFKSSDSKLYCATGSTPSVGATGVSVTTGVWYRIDVKLDQTAGAKVVDAKVDGTDLAQKTSSDAGAPSVIRLGYTVTYTADFYIDDYITSETGADYPFGAGYVNHFVPVSDGAHSTGTAGNFKTGAAGSNITDATTDSYQLIDDVPLDDTTPDADDYINAAADTGAGSNYVEHVFGPASGISTPASAPRAVEVIVAYHQAGTGSGNCSFKLNDNGTEDIITSLSGAGVTTIRYARKHYANPPSGLGGWKASGTNGNFNNLRHRFGYSSDSNPDQYFDCAMIEAEFV